MRAVPFTKMHGLGNDFVIIDDLPRAGADTVPTRLDPAIAQKLCDRRFGVGADQILWLRKPHGPAPADARMEILNADGSTAEMCGNGIRAVALYLHDHGPERKPSYAIETLAGLKKVALHGRLVAVDMGPPLLGGGFPKEGEALTIPPTQLGKPSQTFKFFEVSMGNPHAVFFVDNVSQIELEKIGPLIETHSRFPKRTNVEFVQVRGPHDIQVRVWERGAGITLACGTGACASAVATLASGRAQGRLRVGLPGGDLQIEWGGPGKSVIMEGPATEVFRGEYLG